MFLNMTITNAVSVEANWENMGLMYLYNMLSDDTGVTKVDMFIPVTRSRANYIISKTISYKPAIALELFSHRDNMSFEIQVGMTLNVEIVSLNFQTSRDQSEVEVTSIDLTNNVILKKLEIPPEHLQQHGSACDDKESILVDKLLECPFIKLDYTDFRMSILNGYLLFEDIDVKPFSRLRYREVNSSILICPSDYLKIYETMPEKARVPRESARFINEISSKNLVSLICICTSILSLFVTVVVIAASSELHSLPGFNTLCLCICLLLAQTLYQFGSGQTSLPGWTCAVIGGVCHFLWLSVMFSMHVCSVDMFLIFRKFRLVSHKAIGKKLLKRLVYICSVSLLFVGVNMVISVARSAGQDFGYGGIICYISSSVMQMVTFIIPSVIVVITNIVLFINVMFNISKASIHDLGMKQERNFFDIYARLSTLTGFTWIIGFLLLLIKSDVLEYCFILLNASQGIFIMMAFVLNRRLWKCCQKNFTQTE